jgi:hypothetical protein
MFSPSISTLLVEARVEALHRAARNGGRRRDVTAARRSPAAALASVVTRTATWSRRS